MAKISFKKGLLANLPATYAEGTFYATTDERGLYLDVSDSARIRFGDFQEAANMEALQSITNPNTTALYYVADINVLAKWDGEKYIQINLDTGATDVTTTGSGNVISAVSYDAETRKLTVTKASVPTSDDVVSAIAGVVGTVPNSKTVVEYIDAKTSGIASDEALAQLTDRVGTAESDIDALEAASHTHDNKTVLDGITAAKVEAWDAAEANAKADAKTAQDAADAAQKSADDAAAAAKAAQDDVDALEEKVGTVAEDKTIVEMISDAQTAATYDDTALAARVKAVEDDHLVKDDKTELSDAIDAVKSTLDTFMSDADVTENAVDTLKEIQEYIASDGTAAATMTSNIADNAKAIADETSRAEGEEKALSGRLDTLEAIDHDAYKTADETVLSDAKTYADGLAKNYDAAGAADTAESNAKAYADGLAKNYDAAGTADSALTSAKSYADGLASNYDAAGAASTAESNAKAYADGLASNYDAAGAATTAESNANSYTDTALTWGSF
jgi:hypothetical protein